MSMPLPIKVVIASNDANIAGIAASVIRGNEMAGHRPSFVAADAATFSKEPIFSIAGVEHKYLVLVASPLYLLNPKRIDLWLALDKESEEKALALIKKYGPAPANFYRSKFPTAVEYCGFEITGIPSNKHRLEKWLETLDENLEPWRKRIWDAYSDSS